MGCRSCQSLLVVLAIAIGKAAVWLLISPLVRSGLLALLLWPKSTGLILLRSLLYSMYGIE